MNFENETNFEYVFFNYKSKKFALRASVPTQGM